MRSVGITVRRALLATVAGLLMAEGGLRVYLFEPEANYNYFGRNAFVRDAELGYRHPPGGRFAMAREGSFLPITVRTNARGFRDRRLLKNSPSRGLRLAIAGASNVFGVGVPEERLFHYELERRLREARPEFGEVEVYNLSQSGYMSSQICTLVEQEMKVARTDAVLLVLRPEALGGPPPARRDIDMVAGYRLGARRWWPDSPLDFLRTHSYVVMRVGSFGRRVGWGRPSDRRRGVGDQLDESLGPTVAQLRASRVWVGVLVVHREGPGSERSIVLQSWLARRGVPHLDIWPGPFLQLEGDPHWSILGHRVAAERAVESSLFGSLPPHRALGR